MEMNKESLMALAKRIYHLDAEVYRCVGSSLGRVFVGEEDACVEKLTELMYTRPQGHELRSYLALIANMARTIPDKNNVNRLMSEYNEILQQVSEIPASFGSVDILDETLAGLNPSNLAQKFTGDHHLIICISRTQGSAGTDIGFALADALKINYYDVEIFHEMMSRLEAHQDAQLRLKQLANEELSKHPSSVPAADSERIGQRLTDFERYHGLNKQDAAFFNLSDLICDMASKEDFIVMGRCADHILANNQIPHISIFITAPFEQRVRRMMALNNLDYKKARQQLLKLDRKHQRYYEAYTGKKWGQAANYDLCINSAAYGISESVELIERMINRFPEK